MEAEAEAIAVAAKRLNSEFARAVAGTIARPHRQNRRDRNRQVGPCRQRRLWPRFRAPARRRSSCTRPRPSPATSRYARQDPTVMISKSSTTAESSAWFAYCATSGRRCVGILGNPSSPLASDVDILLDASVRAEADPHNLAPTSSAAVAMALGDALALGLCGPAALPPRSLPVFHPGGQLGYNLTRTAGEVMHCGERAGLAGPRDPPTSGDRREPAPARGRLRRRRRRALPRRRLQPTATSRRRPRSPRRHPHALRHRHHDENARYRVSDARLHEALRLMEDRPSQISVLAVVNPRTTTASDCCACTTSITPGDKRSGTARLN